MRTGSGTCSHPKESLKTEEDEETSSQRDLTNSFPISPSLASGNRESAPKTGRDWPSAEEITPDTITLEGAAGIGTKTDDGAKDG
jgi:hypothetical protein